KSLTVVCTCTGTNTYLLAPIANQPAVTSFTLLQKFAFVASASSTNTVSIAVSGVSGNTFFPLYQDNQGTAVVGLGMIASGGVYEICWNPALNLGVGGFVLTYPTVGVGTTLPTSSAGLPAGAWWNNGGVVSIV